VIGLPVDPALLLGFSATSAAIVVSPGPDTLVILRHALAGGRGRGLAAVGGVQAGLLVHTALAALGISALIAASPVLFKGMAVAGAVYLAWLGLRSLAARGGIRVDSGSAPGSRWQAAREAMLTNLLNPKVLVLFFALYPNFIAPGGPVAVQIGLLSAILIAINVAWQAGLALFADRARRWLARPAVDRVLNRGVGICLLVFAGLLLVEHVF
jgi:threonine/homoserine/homoserine lactone efflux protein